MKTGYRAVVAGLIILALIILFYLGIRALINRNAMAGKNFEQTCTFDDFVLAGIQPASKPAEVVKAFGQPSLVKRTSEPSIHNGDYVSYLETWVYPGLEVEFIYNAEKGQSVPDAPGVVMRLLTTDRRYQTRRGIRVGDPLAKVIRRYGPAEPDDDAYWYCSEADFLLFKVKDRRVASIETGLTFD